MNNPKIVRYKKPKIKFCKWKDTKKGLKCKSKSFRANLCESHFWEKYPNAEFYIDDGGFDN